jgi:hypothetical protein
MLWLTLLVLMILVAAAPIIPLLIEHFTQTNGVAEPSDPRGEPAN